jgi:pSer/pThr/pTyr-binding forkhead associated (FHA) protein
MAKLLISHQGLQLKEYPLDKERVSIGRNSSNDIVLYEPVVSGEHAAIQSSAEGSMIVDLQSTNGSLLNGQPVKKASLRHNDVISIGSHELRFVDKRVQDFASTVIIEQQSDAVATRRAALRILNGPRAGEVMPITRQRTVLGKPGTQVGVILQQGNSYHFLPMKLSGVAITTHINGELLSEQMEPLCFGDEITIADVRLSFFQDPSE